MHPVETFELILVLTLAILALTWAAARLRWPPSVSFLAGGVAMAFLPGLSAMEPDPELMLVLFLPPLLMDGAWSTAIVHFRRHFAGILSLAIGAVLFTTLVVAAVTHWMMPGLPWAACAALGAIVAPPDAVSARAVLQRVALPRRLATLLEGESLLNDAAGLVLFRFAVAAAAGGAFDLGAAAGRFALLAIGGALVGVAIGRVWLLVARRMDDEVLTIVFSTLIGWLAYGIGEGLHVSGVIATVAAGLIMGWHQHEVFTAGARVRGTSFWGVLIFLFEAAVFLLVGLTLRDVLVRAGGIEAILAGMALPVLAIVAAMTAARFVWLIGSDMLLGALRAAGIGREPPIGRAGGIVMGWAGMRGGVTLAIALTLPETMPGRDFMLVAAFAVILVTVVVQGSTLGLVIRWLGVARSVEDDAPLDVFGAEAELARAKLVAVEALARDADGAVVHPQLLERYTRRAAIISTFDGDAAQRDAAIVSHFGIIVAAVGAARAELLRLHRAHQIDDETFASLERDLDLEELAAISAQA